MDSVLVALRRDRMKPGRRVLASVMPFPPGWPDAPGAPDQCAVRTQRHLLLPATHARGFLRTRAADAYRGLFPILWAQCRGRQPYLAVVGVPRSSRSVVGLHLSPIRRVLTETGRRMVEQACRRAGATEPDLVVTPQWVLARVPHARAEALARRLLALVAAHGGPAPRRPATNPSHT